MNCLGSEETLSLPFEVKTIIWTLYVVTGVKFWRDTEVDLGPGISNCELFVPLVYVTL